MVFFFNLFQNLEKNERSNDDFLELSSKLIKKVKFNVIFASTYPHPKKNI